MTTIQEKIEIMQHFADGGEVEVEIEREHDFGWKVVDHPRWNWHERTYRKAVTKPSLDWSHVSDEFNAHATDINGRTWLYDVPPSRSDNDSDGFWLMRGKLITRAAYFASYKPGTCDWRDSLVWRPGHGPDAT